MKTLIWYRSILRDKIVEKLDNLGCSDIAKYQMDYMKKENISMSIIANSEGCIDSQDKDYFGLNTKSIIRIPPDKKTEGLPDLITLLDRAAKKLCLLNRPIDVLWSGGLDSTTTLLLLKRHAEKDQLRIILTEGSIDEHPTLYKSLVRYMPHKINMNKNFRSEIEKDKITVNSNSADKRFLSPKGRVNTINNTGQNTGDLRQVKDADVVRDELTFKFKFYYIWRYGSYVDFRDLAGITFDRLLIEPKKFKDQEKFIPHCQSLYSDWDVTKWFINYQLEKQVPFDPKSKKDFIDDGSFVDQKEVWRKLPYESRLDPDHAIIPIIPYTEAKMELRNYIAEESGDKDYAYGKGDVSSYSHGQIDMFVEKEINPLGFESLNVAVCDDGEIIRRDQLDDIDPFDFITI